MIPTPGHIAKIAETTLGDMRKINNGFLRHEGLELPAEDLKRVLAAANGEMTKTEMLAEVDAKFGV